MRHTQRVRHGNDQGIMSLQIEGCHQARRYPHQRSIDRDTTAQKTCQQID